MALLSSECLIEAKRRVISLAHQGKLLSPKDAWLLSGATRDSQTLWSVAFGVSSQYDCNAEELNEYLEKQFPQYTSSMTPHRDWEDYWRDR